MHGFDKRRVSAGGEFATRQRNVVDRDSVLPQHSRTHTTRRERDYLRLDALLGQPRQQRHEQRGLHRVCDAARAHDVQNSQLTRGSFGHDELLTTLFVDYAKSNQMLTVLVLLTRDAQPEFVNPPTLRG
jgi:hypothetical protein